IRISSPTDGANVEVNLRGLLGLGKNDLNVNEYPGMLGSFGVTSSTKLVTPDMLCPSTHQLLWNSPAYSGPDMSCDVSASPEYLSSLVRASLA
ncbi:hypothetical protein Tco_0083096, partial [Tanacetum coccineum]